MTNCPSCNHSTRQNKAGLTVAGSQRFRCMHCGKRYTPHPKPRGYPLAVRKQALQFYVDGMNLRRIARYLGLHHRTVSLWVTHNAGKIPKTPMPKEVEQAK